MALQKFIHFIRLCFTRIHHFSVKEFCSSYASTPSGASLETEALASFRKAFMSVNLHFTAILRRLYDREAYNGANDAIS